MRNVSLPRLARFVDASALIVGVPADVIRGPTRRADIVAARFAIAWAARVGFEASCRRIGVALGGRDHSSIIHATYRADERRKEDFDFRAVTDRLLVLADELACRD